MTIFLKALKYFVGDSFVKLLLPNFNMHSIVVRFGIFLENKIQKISSLFWLALFIKEPNRKNIVLFFNSQWVNFEVGKLLCSLAKVIKVVVHHKLI